MARPPKLHCTGPDCRIPIAPHDQQQNVESAAYDNYPADDLIRARDT